MASDDLQSVHEQLRKWRRTDDVEGLRRRVYRALRTAEVIMYHPDTDTDKRLKAVTVLQQTARTYLKVLEADELEERIEALEKAEEERQQGRTNGHYTYS